MADDEDGPAARRERQAVVGERVDLVGELQDQVDGVDLPGGRARVLDVEDDLTAARVRLAARVLLTGTPRDANRS